MCLSKTTWLLFWHQENEIKEVFPQLGFCKIGYQSENLLQVFLGVHIQQCWHLEQYKSNLLDCPNI